MTEGRIMLRPPGLWSPIEMPVPTGLRVGMATEPGHPVVSQGVPVTPHPSLPIANVVPW